MVPQALEIFDTKPGTGECDRGPKPFRYLTVKALTDQCCMIQNKHNIQTRMFKVVLLGPVKIDIVTQLGRTFWSTMFTVCICVCVCELADDELQHYDGIRNVNEG